MSSVPFNFLCHIDNSFSVAIFLIEFFVGSLKCNIQRNRLQISAEFLTNHSWQISQRFLFTQHPSLPRYHSVWDTVLSNRYPFKFYLVGTIVTDDFGIVLKRG